jgi:dynein assembly factor 1
MPRLAVLYLNGNDVCKKIKNYRKVLTARIPTLKYLDDRPVFDDDRRYAEAFSRGGIEEERKERDVIKKEKDDDHRRNHEAFKEMIRKAKEEKL